MSQGFASSALARSAFQELAWPEPSGLTFVAGVGSTTTTSHSLTVPGSAAEGDLAFIGFAAANSVPSTPTGGGTWTLVWSADLASNEWQGIWVKTVTGSEPASWSVSCTGSDSGAFAVVYRGITTVREHDWIKSATASTRVTPVRASHQLVFWMKIQGSAHTVPAGVTDDYAYAASNSNTAHFNATHRAPTSVFDLPHDLTVGNASGTYTTATNIIVT